jgi:hypothetical protein
VFKTLLRKAVVRHPAIVQDYSTAKVWSHPLPQYAPKVTPRPFYYLGCGTKRTVGRSILRILRQMIRLRLWAGPLALGSRVESDVSP